MTFEQINMIRLIYARKFYEVGDFAKGDMFLKAVRKSPDKTKEATQLLDEIPKNKKFYQNRQTSKSDLVLSLVP